MRAPRHSACSVHRASAGRRPGFTLLELVVVIALIGILMSLVLPAVQKARESARRIDCMNRLRNVTLAMLNVTDANNRFPACGNFTQHGDHHHSWVLDVLPWLDQTPLAQQWDRSRRIYDPPNLVLTRAAIPVLTCPSDVSVVGAGDLSYVVNSGVGFTSFVNGVHDCPIDPMMRKLDLNGNGVTCPSGAGPDGDPSDKTLLFRMGLFFNETIDAPISRRHHRPATIVDGMSNTLVLAENVRSGHNPQEPQSPWSSSWASPNPTQTSFYIGNPCLNADCSPGQVDYARSNAGFFGLNSGLERPEGSSPVPNSFHPGGVLMSLADGRVQFVSQSIDGGVYAALASPQGMLLSDTPLQQVVATGDF